MLDTIIIEKSTLIKRSSNSHQKKFDEKIKKGLMNDESLMRVLTLVNKGIGRNSHHFIKNIRFLKQQIKQTEMKEIKLTPSVMHHLFLWVYNWKKEDFKIAFETSHLGWNYQWEKFQGNLSGDKCSSSAIIETILNMDDLHQQLLLDYVIRNKYKNTIKRMDENKAFFKNF